MKLSNLFKKSEKSTTKSSIEKLEKNQLGKVIGGADSTTVIDPNTDPTGGDVDKRYRPGNNKTA